MIKQVENPVICILGPTATGKSNFALKISELFPCEIISVDSAMVYREMDIGTAKPSLEVRSHFVHHLIDILDPTEIFSVAEFCAQADKLIKEIQMRQKIPLLVGGTMLYFNALQKGLSDLPSADEKVRMRLQQELEKVGLIALHQRLQQIDPKAANTINANDPQRTLRALEIYEMTGKPMSELWLKSPKKKSQYNFVNFAFMPQDRKNLHKIIEKRFQYMLANGFVEEVERLYRRGDLDADLPSIRSVGYRQIWEYLSGNISYDEMQQKSIVATRQLAKRQMTWLRQWEFYTLSGDFEKDITLLSAYLNLLMIK